MHLIPALVLPFICHKGGEYAAQKPITSETYEKARAALQSWQLCRNAPRARAAFSTRRR